MNLTMPITVLKGIGPKKAKEYQRLGIKTVGDMIEFYPKSYEVSRGFTNISDLKVNEVAMVKGKISQSPAMRRTGRVVMVTTRIMDDTGEAQITWFNQPYLAKQMTVGREVVIKGKYGLKYNRPQFSSPKVLNEKDLSYMADKSVLPIYPIGRGINQKQLRLTIAEAIDYGGGERRDFLPQSIKDTYDLVDLGPAINQVHYPDGEEALGRARHRLIFDEFLLFQLGLMLLKEDQIKITNQFNFSQNQGYDRMKEALPYTLTGAQEKVLGEIRRDMTGDYNMNRLVQGDVGSGKTVVAALAIMLALENGYQGAMMAPTEVLAKQHYMALKEIFEPLGFEVGLLVGSMTKKQKRTTCQSLESGELKLVVGTHAVIQEGVIFKDLSLVITDEQHRFGVKQREILAGKGHYPHVLVMSATPIPRTLALILYGDMDVSIIDEMPPGRQTIETYSVTTAYRERLYQFMLNEVDAGRQCYVVCSKVEEGEDDQLVDVVTYAEQLRQVMPDYVKIEFLHGKLKAKEKNYIMQCFVDGDIDIVVSTTVIEVGINVPNATLMLIENAERFGLAQLHQLRGRVGRGKHKSYCVLVSDSKSQNSKKRMEIMTQSTDGFVISEKDLELRGHGDLMGVRQSGLPTFRIANVMEDAGILKEANEVAKLINQNREILLEDDFRYLDEQINLYIDRYMSYIAL